MTETYLLVAAIFKDVIDFNLEHLIFSHVLIQHPIVSCLLPREGSGEHLRNGWSQAKTIHAVIVLFLLRPFILSIHINGTSIW